MNPATPPTPPAIPPTPTDNPNPRPTDPASAANPTTPESLPVKTLASDSDSGSPLQTFWGYVKFFFEWIVIPFLIVFLFLATTAKAFYVSGSSMNPTFQNGDYLIISEIGVTIKDIHHLFDKNATIDYQRGDILVFRPPIATSTFYIKRLIGLPGDRVVIKNGVVTIYNKAHPDGMVLHESYIDPSAVTMGNIDETVDADNFFVMGDNRLPNASYDSRDWGQLPQNNLVGRVVLRLHPHPRGFGHVTYSSLLEYPLRDGLKLFG